MSSLIKSKNSSSRFRLLRGAGADAHVGGSGADAAGAGGGAGSGADGSSSSWSPTAELGPGLSSGIEAMRTGVGAMPLSQHLIQEDNSGPSFSSGFPTHTLTCPRTLAILFFFF